MDFSYNFNTTLFDPNEQSAIIILIIWLSVILLFGATQIVSYVLRSLSLYTIAKRRGVSGAGWAWTPIIGVDWLIGKLADQYDLKRTGNNRKFSKVLLILTSILYGVILLTYLILVVVMFTFAIRESVGTGSVSETPEFAALLIVYAIFFLALLALYATGILEIIAFYKVYDSCAPKKAILLTFLSVMFGNLAYAICLTAVRNRDDGYLEIRQHEQELAQKYLPQENKVEIKQ